MSLGSLGNRQQRQSKINNTVNHSGNASGVPAAITGQDKITEQPSCTNGICDVTWKPQPAPGKTFEVRR